MIIHRMSTQPPEQPVKFYKGIALSFLFLTILLLGVIIYITSKKVTITVLTKQDQDTITFGAVAGTDATENSIGGKVYSMPFVYSADFSPTGNSQVEDVAKGKVTIYNKTGTPMTLVKTTRLLSDSGVLFRLSAQAQIPAAGQAEAEVYADQKGSSGNIKASKFTIPGLSLEKQKVIFAESKEAMSGGMRSVGSLSSEDIENAKNEYRQKIKGEALKTLSEPENGVERLVAVAEENILSTNSAGEVVGSFKIYGTSTLAIIEYKKNNLSSVTAKEIEKQINSKSERYLPLTGNPKVSVQTVDVAKESAELKVEQELVVMIDANSDNLSPSNFFGKSKDEIERYVMALDHVAGVSVKFTPAWVKTAPAAPDRITVVVKDIK